MRTLHRKLFRDLRRMAPQLAAIALVVASGVALFIAAMMTYRSLRLSEADYYEHQRFARVWSSLARRRCRSPDAFALCPESLPWMPAS